MIPDKTEATVLSNMGGEKIAMRFDEDSLAMLMSILTDIAQDPERYALQEYAVNARDSHIEAGQTKPIEVWTPTALKSTLVIKDYGVGLNVDDIRNVFSLYGASTKRESNEVTGFMGIGSKSALTYTSQFTVVGVKDGVKATVSVSRDEDGGGTMTVLSQKDTREPNGVQIEIPTQRGNEFEEKAISLFQYWEPGTVLLNGKEPARVEGLPVGDSILLVKHKSYGESDVVVMGGVPYDIPYNIAPLRSLKAHRVVAWLPVGSVNITPDRENLQLTKKTRARMEDLQKEVAANLDAWVRSDIASATTRQEAMIKATTWRSALPQGYTALLTTLAWKGEVIPQQIYAAGAGPENEKIKSITVAQKGGKPGRHTTYAGVTTEIMADALIVSGYDPAKFTPSHKRKLEQYALAQQKSWRYFVLSYEPLDTSWFNEDDCVEWAEIKSIKLPREYVSSTGSVKITGSYPSWTGERDYERNMLASDIDASKPIYYFTKETWDTGYGYNRIEKNQQAENEAVKLMLSIQPDCTIVRLGLNRIQKFVRDFPSAERLRDALEAHFNKLYDELDEEIIKAYRIQKDGHSLLRSLDAEKVSDPDLKSAIELAKLKVDKQIEPLLAPVQCGIANLMEHKFWKEIGTKKIAYELDCNYPLLSSSSRVSRGCHEDHIYIYINAIYSYNQAVKTIRGDQEGK